MLKNVPGPSDSSDSYKPGTDSWRNLKIKVLRDTIKQNKDRPNGHLIIEQVMKELDLTDEDLD